MTAGNRANMSCQKRRRRRVHRRHLRYRGVIYVAVLGIALIVGIIGLSALAGVRLQSDVAKAEHTAADAEVLALSYLDVGLLRLTKDPLWRSNYPHDTWLSAETVGGISLTCKIVDEIDGDLLDNAMDPIRMYARATIDDAVRLYSVELQPTDPLWPSIVTNPGFESGTTGWSGFGATIQIDASVVRTGSGALLVTNRSSSSSGPRQNAGSFLNNGTNYTTEVWVRMASGSANVRAVARTTSIFLLTTTHALTPWTTVDTQWTRVSGTNTVNWINLLSSAAIGIETQSGKGSFYVDDFQFYVTGEGGDIPIQIITGTWRTDTVD